MKFLTPLDPASSAPDMVFRRLKDAITTGDLLPGQKLPSEAELARQFQIAPMTIRAALAVMRDLGLMHTIRGRNGGNFIADDVGEQLALAAQSVSLDQAQLRDLTDWRRAISGETCFLAAQRYQAHDWEMLETAFQNYQAHLGQFPALRFADAKFHMVIAQLSGSAKLVAAEQDVQRQMSDVILGAHKPITPGLATYDHGQIFDAIKHRDAPRARHAMILHAEDTFSWLSAVL